MISRRDFAKYAGSCAIVCSMGGALAACLQGCTGGDSANSTGAGSGASAGADEASAQTQVIVAMPTTSEPAAGFNPLVAWGCGEHVHEPLIQSTLITTNVDLEFEGDIATSYECSADGLTWTFNLRDDVVFSDGVALSARDVVFTLNAIKDSAAAQADLSSVESAEATDDTTVIIHMKTPNSALLYTLAVLGIVPEHAYDDAYGENPIGSGRYMLEQWDKGQQVILRANPLYYGQAPKIERVVVLFMSEDASLAAASAAQVDVAYTSAVLAGSVPQSYALLSCKSVDSRGISLPTQPAGSPEKTDGDVSYEVGNDVTCDLAMRQAMNWGVDRARMIDEVLSGWGSEAWSVGDGMPWSSPDMQIEPDQTHAREILDAGGWVSGADGVLEKDGTRASIELYYAAGDSVRQALAASFASQMKELGIEITIKGASWDDIYPHQYSSPVLWGWGSNSPVEMYELLHSRGWGNYASYASDEVDANLDAALAATSTEEACEFYQRAQWDSETGTGVAPQGASTWIWLANIDHLYFVREGLSVSEQKPHPHGQGWSLLNNVDTWEWA